MKFLHVRKRNEDGQYDMHNGVTFCFERYGEEVHFNFAECSKKDFFRKEIGRRVSVGRLERHGAIGVLKIEEGTRIVEKLKQWFNETKEFKKVRKLLNEWN